VLVEANDLFEAALVVVWQSRAPLTDASQFCRQARREAAPRLTLQLFPERIHPAARLCLALVGR
jgi:hypothetical protein